MKSASSSARRVVLGVVLARCPESSAGHICAVMSWAVSFLQAGCEVFLIEAVSSSELTHKHGHGRSDQEHAWVTVLTEFGLLENSCLLIDGRSPDLDRFEAFANSACLFLNYSGQFALQNQLPTGLCKAYLDVDPAFTQVWASQYNCPMNFDGHDVHLTIGLNLDKPSARIPKTGVAWHPVIPPVPAAFWRDYAGKNPAASPAVGAWSTVGHWYGYNTIEWDGIFYTSKRESFLAMRGLPALLPGRQLAIATDLQPEWGDLDGFMEAGWSIVPASDVCKDVASYLAFLAQSKGEIGIAKGGYLVSRCGWISDRSLVYLALGKPVLLQDTGWQEALPGIEKGLLPFQNAADCAEKILRIEADYDDHCRAAPDLADSLFAPEKTIPALLKTCGVL